MESPKDNKQLLRRLVFIVFGSVCLAYGLIGIYTGHISVGGGRLTGIGHHRTYFAAKEPVVFWIVVSVALLVGLVLFYRAIRGWK